MLIGWSIAIVLVVVVVAIHYESMRFLSRELEAGRLLFRARTRMILIMLALFFTHIVEVVVFGTGLFVAERSFGVGTLQGQDGITFADFVYFSMVSYTSLGLGDILPTGELRLITGVEALIGLLMITWSASFTFLYMQRFWHLGTDWPVRED